MIHKTFCMKAKEFDNLIKSKIEENDFEYTPESWDRLSWQMQHTQPAKGINKRFLLTLVSGIAATTALFAAVMFYQSPKETEGTQPITVHSNTLPHAQNNDIVSDNSAAAPQVTANIITPLKKTMLPVRAESIMQVQDLQNEIAKSENAGNEEHVIISTPEDRKNNQSPDLTAKNIPGSRLFTDAIYDQIDNDVIRSKKIKFSFGGGYSYGSVGAGYLVSASAQKKISDRFYIESDLAFVNNSATSTTTKEMPGLSNPDPSKMPGFQTTNVIEPQKITSIENLNLFYVQLTPTVGYNVSKKMTVGMGADFQKLLQQKYTHVSDADGNLYVIPGMDLGFVGKVEYAFSQRIRTGLSYRESANKIIEDKDFLRRNYMQIQLKYRINK
jgi:hypothetical protein